MSNTPTPPKQGVRARERNALERISGLENDFARLVQGVQAAVNEINQKLNTISEVLDAVVTLNGAEKVQQQMADTRRQRAEERAKASKDALDNALLEGTIEQIEKIEDGATITGVEYDKEGKPLPPGYVQLPFDTVKPEFKEKMLGQGVGFKFETEPGGTFEVTGVYKSVPQSEAPDETPSDLEETGDESPAVEAAEGQPAENEKASN